MWFNAAASHATCALSPAGVHGGMARPVAATGRDADVTRRRYFLGAWVCPCPCASGFVSIWLQPALVAQNSQARQVSVEYGL